MWYYLSIYLLFVFLSVLLSICSSSFISSCIGILTFLPLFYSLSVWWLCGAAVLYSTVVVRHVATACCITHAVVIMTLMGFHVLWTVQGKICVHTRHETLLISMVFMLQFNGDVVFYLYFEDLYKHLSFFSFFFFLVCFCIFQLKQESLCFTLVSSLRSKMFFFFFSWGLRGEKNILSRVIETFMTAQMLKSVFIVTPPHENSWEGT